MLDFSKGQLRLESHLKGGVEFESAIPRAVDFGAIRGQTTAKEAAVIAAAGGHNLLLIGPPGEGKSLLASAMPGILPRLTTPEKVQLTKIYSAYGALDHDGEAVTRRPFRAIHHTASKQSLVGGGTGIPKPGEITLAHLGVLFLDEIAEFSRATLETLRQPLESGEVIISRVQATITYPCRVTLVAAMNPCPCGYYGSELCKCKDRDVAAYQKKLSGPLLDRIDLQVELRGCLPTSVLLMPKLSRPRVSERRSRPHGRRSESDLKARISRIMPPYRGGTCENSVHFHQGDLMRTKTW